MNCSDEGMLQAYIDNELTYSEKREIDMHLLKCKYCQQSLKELNENNTFALHKITPYKGMYDSLKDIEIKPFTHKKETFRDFLYKGVDLMMNKYKRITAAAISVALIVTCITVQPVRAAVSDALSIFRVDNVKSMSLTLDEIRQIESEIKNHKSEINMDKLGKMNMTGGQKVSLSLEKAKEITDFKPLFLPAEYNNAISVTTITPTIFTFNLNIGNVNDVLKNLGAKELLPQDLNGKAFTVNLPRELDLQYNMNGRIYSIIEVKTPEILVPEDVNADEIYNSLVDLPVIPVTLQRQLKSIKDWKNTMYIPYVKSSMEEVVINGVKGYTADIDSLKLNPQNPDKHESAVLWYRDGVFYCIQGQDSKEELTKLAQSMR